MCAWVMRIASGPLASVFLSWRATLELVFFSSLLLVLKWTDRDRAAFDEAFSIPFRDRVSLCPNVLLLFDFDFLLFTLVN